MYMCFSLLRGVVGMNIFEPTLLVPIVSLPFLLHPSFFSLPLLWSIDWSHSPLFIFFTYSCGILWWGNHIIPRGFVIPRIFHFLCKVIEVVIDSFLGAEFLLLGMFVSSSLVSLNWHGWLLLLPSVSHIAHTELFSHLRLFLLFVMFSPGCCNSWASCRRRRSILQQVAVSPN